MNTTTKHSAILFLIFFLLATLVPFNALAQSEDCAFGFLEVEIPFISRNICNITLLGYAAALIQLLTAFIVIIGVISVIIGGYLYMTSGGSADRVSQAKMWIASALLGITLALTAWVIMNTISPQFTTRLREPTVDLPK